MDDTSTSHPNSPEVKRISGLLIAGVAVGTSILSVVLIGAMLALAVPFLLQQRMEAMTQDMNAQMSQQFSGGSTFSGEGTPGGLSAPDDPLADNASMIAAAYNMNPDSMKKVTKFAANQVKSGNNNSPMGYEMAPEQWTELSGIQAYDNPGHQTRIHVSEVKNSSAFCVSEWITGSDETLEKRTFADSTGTVHTWKDVFADATSSSAAAENSCAQLFVEDNA